MVLNQMVRRTLLRSGLGSRLSSRPPLSYIKRKRHFYRLRETSAMQEPHVTRLMIKEKG